MRPYRPNAAAIFFVDWGNRGLSQVTRRVDLPLKGSDLLFLSAKGGWFGWGSRISEWPGGLGAERLVSAGNLRESIKRRCCRAGGREP